MLTTLGGYWFAFRSINNTLAGDFVDGWLKLYCNDLPENPIPALTDFVEADFPGYSEVAYPGDMSFAFDFSVPPPYFTLSSSEFNRCLWTNTGPPVRLYGYYVVTHDRTQLLYQTPFDTVQIAKTDVQFAFYCGMSFRLELKPN